jgi:hypothetical protein
MDMCKIIILSDQYHLSLPAAIPAPVCAVRCLRQVLHDKRGGRKWKTIFVKYSYDTVLSLLCKFGNDWITLFLLYTGLLMI